MDAFIARQPILDNELDVFGYELLFRAGPENYFSNIDGDYASSKLMSDSTSVHGLETLTAGRMVFVNVTRKILLDKSFSILPPGQTVIELLETVEPDEEVIAACKELREAGYQLALDDFMFDSKRDPLLAVADFVKVDFAATDPKQRRNFAAHGKRGGFTLVAEKVETREQLHEARHLGYSYFQGFFFCKPKIVSTREIPGVKLTYLRLLDEINQPALDLDRLAEIIRQDVPLSYKLLKYLNSVAFGLRNKVSSIRHAITLLGELAVRRWASQTALTILGEDKPPELLTTSLIRARFCELVGREAQMRDQELDLFTIGLFSVIDALVDRPMPEVLAGISMWPYVKDTLLGEQTNLSPVYELVLALERGQWDRVTSITGRLPVSEAKIVECYRRSIHYADSVYEPSPKAEARLASY